MDFVCIKYHRPGAKNKNSEPLIAINSRKRKRKGKKKKPEVKNHREY